MISRFLENLWRMSYDSPTIDILRNSKYAVPVIQSFHLFGITLLLGGMVILNLRLLGIGFVQVPMGVLARQVWRWVIGGLLLAIVSGVLVLCRTRRATRPTTRSALRWWCYARPLRFSS